jgi:hypothetical protein
LDSSNSFESVCIERQENIFFTRQQARCVFSNVVTNIFRHAGWVRKPNFPSARRKRFEQRVRLVVVIGTNYDAVGLIDPTAQWRREGGGREG